MNDNSTQLGAYDRLAAAHRLPANIGPDDITRTVMLYPDDVPADLAQAAIDALRITIN